MKKYVILSILFIGFMFSLPSAGKAISNAEFAKLYNLLYAQTRSAVPYSTVEQPTRATIDCDVNTTPSITVLSPNGGETYLNTAALKVKWKSSCNIASNTTLAVELLYGTDGVMTAFVPNTGSHTFQLSPSALINSPVPPSQSVTYGLHFKVHVGTPPATFPSYHDWSDNLFTINQSSEPVDTPALYRPTTTPSTSSSGAEFSLDAYTNLSDSQFRALSKTQAAFDIQRELQSLGVYKGTIDGLLGKGSISALRNLNQNQKAVAPVEVAAYPQKGTLHSFYHSGQRDNADGVPMWFDNLLSTLAPFGIVEIGHHDSLPFPYNTTQIKTITFKIHPDPVSLTIPTGTKFYLFNNGYQLDQKTINVNTKEVTFDFADWTNNPNNYVDKTGGFKMFGTESRQFWLYTDWTDIKGDIKLVKMTASIPCSKIFLPEGNNSCPTLPVYKAQ